MLEKIVEELKKIDEVDAVLLSGSSTTGTEDESSDYDVYVYLTGEIPVEKRKKIYDKYCSYMEIDNKFWETEDDGVLKSGKEIEIIFRYYDWIEGMLERVVEKNGADVGYTTCFWNNIITSKILFDRNGNAVKLKKRFDVEYSDILQKNIIEKNQPLLDGIMSSYTNQIKKALKRNDIVSINHRVAAFLASYFDILFALNKIKHPGEKKLIKTVKESCKIIPDGFEKIPELIKKAGEGNPDIVDLLLELSKGIKKH